MPTMEIGISQNTWKEVVAVAVHEAFEYAVSRQNLRYNLSEMTPPFAHDSYIFIMDHARFHECCARVGEFLADVLPPLATEYRRHIKEEKRKEKAKDAGTEAQQARDLW